MQTESKNESVLNPYCPVKEQSNENQNLNQKINQKAHTNHIFVSNWVQSNREGYHQNNCSACGEVIYEACNMEDVYENGVLKEKKCSTCGRTESITVDEHIHNYLDFPRMLLQQVYEHEIFCSCF